MKNTELHIKKGDHVWVQIYNGRDYSFHPRLAEVIATLHLRISCEVVPYVALRYLDASLMNKSVEYAINPPNHQLKYFQQAIIK